MICCDLFHSKCSLTSFWCCILGKTKKKPYCFWLNTTNWKIRSAYMYCFDKVFEEISFFSLHLWEAHIDRFVPRRKEIERDWCAFNAAQTQTSSMKPAMCTLLKDELWFEVSSIYIYHFIGVLGHNTESLHFFTEQWAKDEHVGCERTNSVDLFLWMSFSLFSSLLALTQNHSALLLFCSSTQLCFISFLSYLSVSLSPSLSVFQRSHLQRAAAEHCPLKD